MRIMNLYSFVYSILLIFNYYFEISSTACLYENHIPMLNLSLFQPYLEKWFCLRLSICFGKKMSEPEIEPYIWKFWGQFFESSSEFFTYSVQRGWCLSLSYLSERHQPLWICLLNSHNHTKFSFWVIRKFLIFFPYVTIFWHKVANLSLPIQEIPCWII